MSGFRESAEHHHLPRPSAVNLRHPDIETLTSPCTSPNGALPPMFVVHANKGVGVEPGFHGGHGVAAQMRASRDV